MFSKRGAFDLTPNALARMSERTPPRWDLTCSNPTRAGIAFGDEALSSVRNATPDFYDPHPRGIVSARRKHAAPAAMVPQNTGGLSGKSGPGDIAESKAIQRIPHVLRV